MFYEKFVVSLTSNQFIKSTERTFLYLSELQKKLFAVLIWTETILDQNWILYLVFLLKYLY